MSGFFVDGSRSEKNMDKVPSNNRSLSAILPFRVCFVLGVVNFTFFQAIVLNPEIFSIVLLLYVIQKRFVDFNCFTTRVENNWLMTSFQNMIVNPEF